MSTITKCLSILFILFLFSASTGTAQTAIYPFEDLEGEEFNFRVTRSADYTNYLETSMLITVVGEQQQSFAILASGENKSNGVWISGMEQYSVEKLVDIGPLYHAGFNASSVEVKSGEVTPFNQTYPQKDNMNSSVVISPSPFVHSSLINVNLANSTFISPYFQLEPVYFVTDVESYMLSNEQILQEYSDKILSNYSISPDIFRDDNSVEYIMEGVLPDIHEFTSYQNSTFTNITQYHELDVEGNIFIEFGDDKVLNDYSISYEISFEDTRIMNYDYSVSVRTGSGGNINIGEAGFNPGWEVFTIFSAVNMVLFIYLIWKQRQFVIADS